MTKRYRIIKNSKEPGIFWYLGITESVFWTFDKDGATSFTDRETAEEHLNLIPEGMRADTGIIDETTI